MAFPPYLLKVIDALKGLPGVGSKTAERYAFQMLDWRPNRLQELSELIKEIPMHLKFCNACGSLMGDQPCTFCNRISHTLCIVATPKDVFAIEETGSFDGLYHVLGGLLSPLEGRGPEVLKLEKLQERIESLNIQEVIIALDSTLEGDATALYLKDVLSITTSRLAFGLPMGSPLDYVDPGTLSRALTGRRLQN